MALPDLHLTQAPALDYALLTRCDGHGCPHVKVSYVIRAGEMMKKALRFDCAHFESEGESAALWARRNADGTCPHHRGIAA
jgi:hypothetical protein